MYTVLYSFTGGVDGGQPLAPLVRDSAGNLYGTAQSGGSFNFGVVFKVSPTGQQTVLHHFTGKADGGYPTAGLIQDAAGNLYGTTSGGGVRCIASGTGCGVIFKLDPAGNETVLYRFTAGPDGAFPGGTLLRDNSGTLYGTAAQGGIAGACGGLGCGVVFEISATGQHRVLYTFTGGTDGGEPVIRQVTSTERHHSEVYPADAGSGAEWSSNSRRQARSPCSTPSREDWMVAFPRQVCVAIRRAISTAQPNTEVHPTGELSSSWIPAATRPYCTASLAALTEQRPDQT